MTTVAYIILNYNTWQETINEVELIHKVLNVRFEDVIVVDNKSSNESVVNLREYSNNKKIQFIQAKKNCGYAAGNNIGLKYARNCGYKYAWILNNDIIIKDSQLTKTILQVFEKDSKIAIASPDIYMPNGHLCNRDSKRPNCYDFTIGMIKYRKVGRRIKDLGGYGYVYRPQGCSMMVDLEKLDEIGYLDEYTFLYCEELILAEKLLRYNYKCVCVFSTSIIHNHSKTVKSELDKRKIRKIMGQSFKYYLKKYRPSSVIHILKNMIFNEIKMKLIV